LVRINRVYTRTGDGGKTRLVGGQEVDKDSLRIEAYGTVDELNAALGVVIEANRSPVGAAPESSARMERILRRIQNELFNLGSDLATRIEDRWQGQPLIEQRHIEALEREIDSMNAELDALKSFVLPGGGPVGAAMHVARTICRRAERVCVTLAREEPIGPHDIPYLNRLSDALFVFGRWAAKKRGEPEPLWTPEST
jgi:cob(I)alamin adenosyltransferase